MLVGRRARLRDTSESSMHLMGSSEVQCSTNSYTKLLLGVGAESLPAPCRPKPNSMLRLRAVLRSIVLQLPGGYDSRQYAFKSGMFRCKKMRNLAPPPGPEYNRAGPGSRDKRGGLSSKVLPSEGVPITDWD